MLTEIKRSYRRLPLGKRVQLGVLALLVVLCTVILFHQLVRPRGRSPGFQVQLRQSQGSPGFQVQLNQSQRSRGFQVQLTDGELASLLDTVDVFASLLTNASITFFMDSGTLLGSWRHHGLIPWDDDVDFGLLYDDMERISLALNQVQPLYYLNKDHPKRWKFYSAHATRIKHVTWKFPFVDLSFYPFNLTHIWDWDTYHYPSSCVLLTEVFPLTSRPFHGRQLPAPRDVSGVLKKQYGAEVCSTSGYDHRHETGYNPIETQPCQKLMDRYPFVHRVSLAGGGCNETLVLNDKVLSWQAFPGQPC